MHLISITTFALITYLLTAYPGDTTSLWVSNSTTHTDRTINTVGEMPEGYVLQIWFPDSDFTHTHTQNHGTSRISVEVSGAVDYQRSGQVQQVVCTYYCHISSQNGVVSGNLQITKTTTVLGTISQEKLDEELRQKVIETIIQQIEQL